MNTRNIYEVCRPVRIFGGVYARTGQLQTDSETGEAINVVNPDPLWAPGEHWFVVDHTQYPCVVFDSYGGQSPLSSSVFWQGTLGAAYFLNNALQGLTTNVCGDYCIFYVFLRAMGKTPRPCFSLLSKLGDSTHDRDHSVHEMCLSIFGAFDNNGVHVSPLLNQICKAS